MGWLFGDDEEEGGGEDRHYDTGWFTTDEEDLEIAAQQQFQEQCFLVSMLAAKHPALYNGRSKNGSYKYCSVITGEKGDPSTVMSELTSIGTAQALFNVTSDELAYLQPIIKFYKVFEKGNEEYQTEFKFSEGSFQATQQEQQIILQSKGGRGDDVGIESVSFELLATQPAEISNNIVANVKLFFKNISALERPADAEGTGDLKYMDLILRPKSGKGSEFYHPEHYRVKLVVGWAMPAGVKIRDDLREAILRTKTVLNLTLKSHTFNFEMDGTVGLDIEYHAWVEGALSSEVTDILRPRLMDRIALGQLDEMLEAEGLMNKDTLGSTPIMEKSGGSTPGVSGVGLPDIEEEGGFFDFLNPFSEPTKKESTAEEKKLLQARVLKKSYKRFMTRLLGGGLAKMYYMDVDPRQVGKEDDGQVKSSTLAKERCEKLANQQDSSIVDWGGADVDDLEDLEEDMNSLLEEQEDPGWFNDVEGEQEDLKETIAEISEEAKDGKYRIMYFFFGDLLEVALDILHHDTGSPTSPGFRGSAAEKLIFTLGPMFIAHPCNREKLISFNIADIPVSLSMFMNWWNDSVVAQEKKKYFLRDFINDVVGKLFHRCLGSDCFDGKPQTLKVYTEPFYLRGGGAGGKINPMPKGSVRSVDEIRQFKEKIEYTSDGPIKTFDYLILYSYGLAPEFLVGNKEKDTAMGIYHFDLGLDRGILKNITFSKNDAPYLGEAKVTGDNDIGNDLAGGAIYNAELELVGNGLFVPGQYFYVNPRSLGLGNPKNADSIATRIRLGGYYIVTKVSSDLAIGDFTTKITGIWETSPNFENLPEHNSVNKFGSYGYKSEKDIEDDGLF